MHVDLICANKTTEDVDVCVCGRARACGKSESERKMAQERRGGAGVLVSGGSHS